MANSPIRAIPGLSDETIGRSFPGNDPVRNFRFLVTFLPVVAGSGESPGWAPQGRIGFNSVSGLAVSAEPFAIREGGYNTTYHQIPTQVSFSPVTFQRGVFLGTSQHWDWLKNLFAVVQGRATGTSALFRTDVEIAVLHNPVRYSNGGAAYSAGNELSDGSNAVSASLDDNVAMRFRLYNTWPSSVAYSDLNASDNALMVEQMTLVHEGLDMKWSEYDMSGAGVSGILPSAPSF